ncbi:MAG: ABC transporter ATP-binding protein [Candidatus Berkelbacteria bacterium]
MSTTPLIKIEKLTKGFGKDDARVQVLNGIDLEIHSGEYIIFFGPSGCGKSTLLNCIAGLEKPDSGRVVVRGEDLSKMDKTQLAIYRSKKIGMIFQQFNVLKSFNVLNNIALPQSFSGVPYKRRMARAQHLLQMFDLGKISKRLPTEISGGQQQRVAIARALVNNPWILIVDEPTGSLDSKASVEVMDLIARLNSVSKRTVILVTHNPEQLKYAHRIFYMKDGAIIKEEKKKSVEHTSDDEPGEVKI